MPAGFPAFLNREKSLNLTCDSGMSNVTHCRLSLLQGIKDLNCDKMGSVLLIIKKKSNFLKQKWEEKRERRNLILRLRAILSCL